MHDMILKTLTSEGPLSAGLIAELIGEDAEAVKIELQNLITFGLVVKNGRHRYQANHKPKAEAVEQDKPEKTAAEVMDDAQAGGSKTIADVLDEMQRRLKSKPHTVKNLDEKLKALTRLYEMTDQPLKSLLLEIMTDLEATNKNG